MPSDCQNKQNKLLKHDLLPASFLVQWTGSVRKTSGQEKDVPWTAPSPTPNSATQDCTCLVKSPSVINLLVFVSQVNRQLRSEDKACTFSTCKDREKFSHSTIEEVFSDLSAFYCICNTLHWSTPDLVKCKTSSLSLRLLQAYFYIWSHGQQLEQLYSDFGYYSFHLQNNLVR